MAAVALAASSIETVANSSPGMDGLGTPAASTIGGVFAQSYCQRVAAGREVNRGQPYTDRVQPLGPIQQPKSLRDELE